MPYIDNNRKQLEKRHYVNDATSKTHWYDVNKIKYEKYLAKYGDDFCIVLVCSHPSPGLDDSYVLPVRQFVQFFRPEYLRKPRSVWVWMGHIRNVELTLEFPGLPHITKPLDTYYNAFHLLTDSPKYVPEDSEYE